MVSLAWFSNMWDRKVVFNLKSPQLAVYARKYVSFSNKLLSSPLNCLTCIYAKRILRIELVTGNVIGWKLTMSPQRVNYSWSSTNYTFYHEFNYEDSTRGKLLFEIFLYYKLECLLEISTTKFPPSEFSLHIRFIYGKKS